MRLQTLDRWVLAWALPQMYAGVAQQGAGEAAYTVMSDIKNVTMEGTPFCGGVAVLHKVVDQFLRQLAYKLLE